MSQTHSAGEASSTAPGDTGYAGARAASGESPQPRSGPLVFSEQVEFAWACGLFEGEGYITRKAKSGDKNTQMGINMTDKDVLEKFCGIVGCGKVMLKNSQGYTASINGSNEKLLISEVMGYKQAYYWRIGDWSLVKPLLIRMRPFMGARRRTKIDEMLADPPGLGGAVKIYILGRECPNGHLLTEETLAEHRDYGYGASRYCRICRNEYKRNYRKRTGKH